MTDEFSPIQGSQALFHGFTETLFVFQQVADGFLCQSFRISASSSGDALKSRFLLRGQAHFHAYRLGREPGQVKLMLSGS
jgi:hypothetical protein